DWADVSPVDATGRSIHREIAVSGDVWLGCRRGAAPGHKDAGQPLDVLEDISVVLGVGQEKLFDPLAQTLVRVIGDRRHFHSPVDEFVAVAFLAAGPLKLLQGQGSPLVPWCEAELRLHGPCPPVRCPADAASSMTITHESSEATELIGLSVFFSFDQRP